MVITITWTPEALQPSVGPPQQLIYNTLTYLLICTIFLLQYPSGYLPFLYSSYMLSLQINLLSSIPRRCPQIPLLPTSPYIPFLYRTENSLWIFLLKTWNFILSRFLRVEAWGHTLILGALKSDILI